MNDRQIEICDIALKYFVKRDGQASDVEFRNEFLTHGITISESNLVMGVLIDDYKLIKRYETRFDLKRLTPLGYVVAKTGMKSFIEEKKNEEKLKYQSLRRSVQFPLWSIRISLLAIIVTAIGIIANNYQNRSLKHEYQNYYNKHQIDSLLNIIKRENSIRLHQIDTPLIKNNKK